MAKKDFTTPLTLNGDYPNLDDRYTNNGDPYTSVSAAQTALASKLNAYYIGLTVLVKESSWPKAKEYWVQPKGTTPETYGLMEKGAGTTNYNDLENKPTIGDGTNTALPIVGNVKVSASTASGDSAGVTVTPRQNTGEIEMHFTLPKGADGADGQDGQDGAPGHNPCLGRFNVLPTLSPNPFADARKGDYIYFDTTDQQTSDPVTYVYYFDGTDWDTTGTLVDASNLSFRSGQDIVGVAIKGIDGEDNPNAQGVLSAEAGAKLSSDVDAITKDLYNGFDQHIVQGTIYNGNISDDLTCLADDTYHQVVEKGIVRVIHKSGVRVRVTEYSYNGSSYSYLRNSGSYAEFDSLVLGDNTTHVRISAKYPSSITPVGFQDGDFSVHFSLAQLNQSGLSNAEISISNLSSSVATLASEANKYDASLYFVGGEQPSFSRVFASVGGVNTATLNAGLPRFRILSCNGKVIKDTTDYRGQTFTITNYQCLVWNLTDAVLEVVSYPVAGSDKYIPFLGVYGDAVFGLMKPYYDRWLESTLADEIGVNSADIGNWSESKTDADRIVVGTLFHGNIAIPNTKDCLTADEFVEVSPSTIIGIIRKSSVAVRIAQYGSDGTWISDSGNYAKINSFKVEPTTYKIKISAKYDGYSQDNPIAASDFTEGDFGIVRSITEEVSAIKDVTDNNVINRNREKIGRIKAANHRVNQTANIVIKNYTFAIATDIHGNFQCLRNAIDLADGLDEIDSVFILGDMITNNYSPSEVASFQDAFAYGAKPKYVVIGNHDVGNSIAVRLSCTHQQAYDNYIKPMVDAGYLANGEYTAGKGYYYHDIAGKNLRIIVLNDFDEIIELADNAYWQPTTYNAAYPQIDSGTTYTVGDHVNCGAYTDYSFECIQAGEAGTAANEPKYKMLRGYRVIQYDQAQWFLDTLHDAAENSLSVVVMSHILFSKVATPDTSLKFCQNNPYTPSSFIQNYMTTDFVSDAINAFVNKENYSENIVFRSDATYMNTEGGDSPAGGGSFAYTVSKNFSDLAETKFVGFVGGHWHQDIIWKHPTYTYQKSVTPISSRPNASIIGRADIARSTNVKDVSYDAITIVGVDTDSKKFALARVGADVSSDMYVRDVEKV